MISHQLQLPGGSGGKRTSARMTNFDGLRGVGIVLVILYHMGYRLVRHAWLCISILFTLSGLLITGITVQSYERTGQIDVVRFWSRRVGRLFPALFVTIILSALSRFVRDEDQAEFWYERNDLLWACTFLSNYNMVFVRKDDYFAAFQKPSITRHMWTLAIEEQYYLVWPIIFFVWTRFFPGVKKASGTHMEEERQGLVEQEGTTGESSIQLRNADKNQAKERDYVTDGVADDDNPVLPLIKALCVGEGVVIVFSYFSSWVTISELGMSAAYYSTWSRMGDLACGGLMYLLVRLHPQVYRRYTQQPGLELMSTEYRIILEVLWFFALCLTILTPMIQVPLDDALHIYFYYLRLPFSFLICVFSVAGVLQISEPLPAWAVFSRALNSKPMVVLGVISYGVYLNHWPIILFFGSPIDKGKFETAKERGTTSSEPVKDDMARDALLMFISLSFGYISFEFYERPLLRLGAKQKHPWKVVAVGLIGAAVTAAAVVGCFWDINDPHSRSSDVLAVFGDQHITQGQAGVLDTATNIPGLPSSFLSSKHSSGFDIPVRPSPSPDFLPSPEPSTSVSPPVSTDPPAPFPPVAPPPHASPPEPGLLPAPPQDAGTLADRTASAIDTRFTPVFMFMSPSKRSTTRLVDILDDKTRPQRQIGCMTSKHDDAGACGKEANVKVYNQLSELHPSNSIVIMCATYSFLSPCDVGEWKNGTSWIWLRSPVLCGLGDRLPVHAKRCSEQIAIYDMEMPNGPDSKNGGGANTVPGHAFHGATWTGKTSLDQIYLMRTLLKVDQLIPGAMNQASLERVQDLLDVAEKKEWAMQQEVVIDDMDWDSSLKLLVMGESVADRIAGIFKELVEASLPCVVDKLKQRDFPRLNIVNLAHLGGLCISYFKPCNTTMPSSAFEKKGVCTPKRAGERNEVLNSIPKVKPDVVVVHDGKWSVDSQFSDDGMRIESMSTFLAQALNQGVKRVVYMTHSEVAANQFQRVQKELRLLELLVRGLQCEKNERGIHFSVLKWHLLTCPTHEEAHCSHQAHGFYDILPDEVHPSGPSGSWLCAQALAAILAQTALDLPAQFGYPLGDWDRALENPMSTCLLEHDRPDNDPSLKDILDTHWLCP